MCFEGVSLSGICEYLIMDVDKIIMNPLKKINLCVVIKVLISVNIMRCIVKLKVEIDKFARKSI